jgi:hypothetical protein
MRVRTKQVAGEAVVLDPADPGPFADFSGEQFLGMDGGAAVVRGRGATGSDGRRVPGPVVHVRGGTAAVLVDGAGGVTFVAPENFESDGSWETA